jgi:shikimate kinase
MKNIVLTGFMGTGKTELGKILSKKLDCVLVDVDNELEKEEGMTISEIFRQHGEPGFRERETAMIRTIAERERVVVSTGGGAVLRQENMDALREKGVIVCLTARPETVLHRTRGSKDRPLLQVEDPLGKIRELMEFRKPFYEKADMVINTDGKTPLQVAEEIIGGINKKS